MSNYNVRLTPLGPISGKKDKKGNGVANGKMPLLCLSTLYKKLDNITSESEADRKNSKKSSKNS